MADYSEWLAVMNRDFGDEPEVVRKRAAEYLANTGATTEANDRNSMTVQWVVGEVKAERIFEMKSYGVVTVG